MAYTPTLTSKEWRDGMVYVVVDFNDNTGKPTVTRKTHTDTFTAEWFRQWCKRQADQLNAPQEIDAVAIGVIDLTGVTLEPDAGSKARQQFNEKLADMERMAKLASLGVIAADHAEIVETRNEMVTAIAARPGLLKVK